MLAAVMVIGMLGMTVFAGEAAPSQAPVEGSWKLYQVCEVKDGQEPVLLKKDENQSLYGSGISILVFDKDGVGHNRIFEAGNLTDKDASWASPSENVYTFTEKDAAELTFNYAPQQDLLHRNYQDGE